MIGELDQTLAELLRTRVTRLRSGTPPTVQPEQVGFQPPDSAWRNVVTTAGRRALNVFLADVRENRRLRTNVTERAVVNGVYEEEPAPVRLDCHYLVTAWSPADENAGKTLDEHDLLYEAASVLLTADPLVPQDVWGGTLPGTFIDLPADTQLPVNALPVEGFAQLPYFWGAMGGGARWKPPLYVVVTLPVARPRIVTGPPVTAAITDHLLNGGGTTEKLVQIGGLVLDARTVPALPVAGARVVAESLGGEAVTEAHSGDDGRYVLVGLAPGRYRLRASAPGLPPVDRVLDVPAPTGVHDLSFT